MREQTSITTTIGKTIDDAKMQILEYKSLLKMQNEYQNKQIFGYVVLRCGPSKLYGFAA